MEFFPISRKTDLSDNEVKNMNRPYIICHILSALDGKIAGDFMGTAVNRKAAAEYSRIRDAYGAQAWLYGTTTTKEFTGFREPVLESMRENVPDGDYVAESGWNLYYVSVDTQGEIAWDSGAYKRAGRPDSHVIEILTEKTPPEYRAYLRKQGVSYILAGEDTLDCQIAAQKLKALFGIEKVLICGGGTVNWSFLSDGVVDELSLLLSPVADGNPDTPTVFERMAQLIETEPVSFHLKNVSQLQKDVVHLTYTTENQKE